MKPTGENMKRGGCHRGLEEVAFVRRPGRCGQRHPAVYRGCPLTGNVRAASRLVRAIRQQAYPQQLWVKANHVPRLEARERNAHADEHSQPGLSLIRWASAERMSIMPTTSLRRARVEQPLVVSTAAGLTEVLSPGEYFVEDAGLLVKLHPSAEGQSLGAELKMTTFDALLTQRRLVFLSWH